MAFKQNSDDFLQKFVTVVCSEIPSATYECFENLKNDDDTVRNLIEKLNCKKILYKSHFIQFVKRNEEKLNNIFLRSTSEACEKRYNAKIMEAGSQNR